MSWPRVTLAGVLAAGLWSVIAPAPSRGQEDGERQAPAATSMKDCEQTDSAPLVIRACTAILNAGDVEPAERKRILFLRAVAWSKEEDFHAAADDYTGILAIEPDNLKALEGRAIARGKGGEHAKSVVDFTALIARDGANSEYHRRRGVEHLGVKDYEQALADLAKAIEIDPKGVDAYINRAQVYDALGDRKNATAEFERGIAADANNINLHWVRGEMARAWGEKELAIASYTRVLELNSLHEDARRRIFNMGVLHPP